MSLRALICSSPIADITLTTKSFPSAKPSLICPYSKQRNNQRSIPSTHNIEDGKQRNTVHDYKIAPLHSHEAPKKQTTE